MIELKNATIHRGGVTSNYTSVETKSCRFGVGNVMHFHFCLASKGGGTTQVCLEIGMGDLREILLAVVTEHPEQVSVLLECASIAGKKNLELLAEARHAEKNGRTRTKDQIKKLEVVKEFVRDKYIKAPSGEDKKESEANNLIGEVINDLYAQSIGPAR